MKLLYTIVILLLVYPDDTNNIEGKYFNYFGCGLQLNLNHTFKFTWNFDLASSWSTGKWKEKNYTIYFEVIPIYDMLRLPNKKDSLFLSMDEKPEVVTDKTLSIIHIISSGGQNRYEMSKKLFYKDGKLFEIKKSGKLDLSKQKQFWTNEKYNTWYIRKE